MNRDLTIAPLLRNLGVLNTTLHQLTFLDTHAYAFVKSPKFLSVINCPLVRGYFVFEIS